MEDKKQFFEIYQKVKKRRNEYKNFRFKNNIKNFTDA